MTDLSGWRANVMESVKKPESLSRRARERNRFLLQAHVPPSFIHLFDRATNQLDYSQASWLRRAVAVQFSRQLGIPLSDILSDTTAVRRRGTSLPRYGNGGLHDRMEDIDPFCPHPGCDGSHFR